MYPFIYIHLYSQSSICVRILLQFSVKLFWHASDIIYYPLKEHFSPSLSVFCNFPGRHNATKYIYINLKFSLQTAGFGFSRYIEAGQWRINYYYVYSRRWYEIVCIRCLQQQTNRFVVICCASRFDC